MEQRGPDLSDFSRLAHLVQWGSMVFGAVALGVLCWKIGELGSKARLSRERAAASRMIYEGISGVTQVGQP
jgi:hypothetical protein